MVAREALGKGACSDGEERRGLPQPMQEKLRLASLSVSNISQK